MSSRAATARDVDAVVATITLAFLADPVWGVALARSDESTAHLDTYWRLFVEGALRYSTVFMLEGAAAVSVWIPPTGTELSDAQQSALDEVIHANLEPAAAEAFDELWSRFDANHPHHEPHAYLSLLATHPDHRGRGIGQLLLAEDLARFDAEGLATYLESTNPGNDHRYERAGFVRIGEFRSVVDNAPISMMWRPAASGEPR
jgi:ribosomal protein S18 acetylase RimI-like enzyme